nr:MAG TPA: hypothetical protein [Caudoviricetes sp.]
MYCEIKKLKIFLKIKNIIFSIKESYFNLI